VTTVNRLHRSAYTLPQEVDLSDFFQTSPQALQSHRRLPAFALLHPRPKSFTDHDDKARRHEITECRRLLLPAIAVEAPWWRYAVFVGTHVVYFPRNDRAVVVHADHEVVVPEKSPDGLAVPLHFPNALWAGSFARISQNNYSMIVEIPDRGQ
jgi:hypothetical protein